MNIFCYNASQLYECLKSKKCKILKSTPLYDALLSQGEISKGKRQIIVIKKTH